MLCEFMSFIQNGILLKTFVESQFEVIYFMSFKQQRILMKTFVECQFEVIYFYEFQTKGNSDEDISWVSV